MSDLRKAAQQALDRLRKYHHGNGFVEDAECIVALEAALAQQPEPAQEPDFHGFMSADGTQVDLCFTPSVPRSDGTYATAYYTTPPPRPLAQEQPEPAQEPLVWEPTWRLQALTQREYDTLEESLRWHYKRITPPKIESVQEPVGWLNGDDEYADFMHRELARIHQQRGSSTPKFFTIPVYTKPFRSKPLTDEEIRAHADKHLRYQPQSYEASGVFDLARAVERAVRGETE